MEYAPSHNKVRQGAVNDFINKYRIGIKGTSDMYRNKDSVSVRLVFPLSTRPTYL